MTGRVTWEGAPGWGAEVGGRLLQGLADALRSPANDERHQRQIEQGMTDREAQQALVEPDVIEPDQEADRDDQLGREQDQQEKEQEGTGPPTLSPREREAGQNSQTDGDDHVDRGGPQGDIERLDHPRVLEHCGIPKGREFLPDI
jgi:hypothetical protein